MKIYTAVFRPWHTPYAWFGRDSGLVTQGFRAIGVESQLVILETPGIPEDERFLPATAEQFADVSFWKGLALDAVILQGGGEGQNEPICRIIRAAGIQLFFRMDSDGVIAPQVDPLLTIYGRWWWLAFHKKPFPFLQSLANTVVKTIFPDQWGPGRIARRMALADGILMETLPAQARLQRLLSDFGCQNLAERVYQVPIPIPEDRRYDPTHPKEKLLIATARWDDAQKDAPKLIKVLAGVLQRWPDYRAVIIGNGDELLRKLIARHAPNVADRIELMGRMAHEAIPPYLQRARVFVCTSRGEGFPNAVAESLCSGCSVAGPAQVAAMHYFTSHSSGSLAWTRRTNDLADAVSSEINAWETGQRDPANISRHFGELLSPATIAKKIIELVDQSKRRNHP